MDHVAMTYGAKVDAEDLIRFLDHAVHLNGRAEREGRKKTPLCIWGDHGIGKTEIVESYAQNRGYHYRYLAPAQFEEMGDLIGMPEIRNGQTMFNPPSWVPNVQGPGILLIDDVNRADERILRGLMQLLQQYRMVSWQLPAQWHIVLTANPDYGDYSVTPMDPALLSRMMHITLNFESKAWANWAFSQKIEGEFIQFVLSFPDLIDGKRCTARTLIQFYEGIAPLTQPKQKTDLLRMVGYATIGPEATEAFIGFFDQNLHELPTPEKILETKSFQTDVAVILERLVKQEGLRVDILAGLQIRLANCLVNREKKLSILEMDNLRSYLKIPWIPEDLKFSFVQELVKTNKKQMDKIMEDPEIGHLLLLGI